MKIKSLEDLLAEGWVEEDDKLTRPHYLTMSKLLCRHLGEEVSVTTGFSGEKQQHKLWKEVFQVIVENSIEYIDPDALDE